MTANDFPYIKSIQVNDCFAYKNFTIDLPNLNGKPFSHLILTGKNGSGKTTILRGVEYHLGIALFPDNVNTSGFAYPQLLDTLVVSHKNNPKEQEKWKTKKTLFKAITLKNTNIAAFNPFIGKCIFSFFAANRQANPTEVNTLTKETDFTTQLAAAQSTDFFIQKFKQYLVNKKVQQAFFQLNKNANGVQVVAQFFDKFTKILQRFFEDDALTLVFEDKNFEFYVVLKDGRPMTFNQMSEGFSAFISILVDLLIRVDLIRSAVNDNSYEPCGIVLLDEPETHLHIKAQYDVLPILTEFFPNIQFIVATHSPAVISSIKNTTVYDLTRQASVTDEIVGSSFSELMIVHFGLDNEFSPIADAIINNVEKAMKENKGDKKGLKMKMQGILTENERYLSPTLRLELESIILENS